MARLSRRTLLAAGAGGVAALASAAFLIRDDVRARSGASAPSPDAAPSTGSPSTSTASPSGTTGASLRTDLSVPSRLLRRDVPYSLYLPAGARSAADGTAPLPVVFLLHGAQGGHTDWVRKGGVQQALDRVVESGRAPACALVMPDARRDPGKGASGQDETFYMNDLESAGAALRYEDMFIQEFLPAVERAHGLGGTAAKRTVAGLSMGGYGALMYATRHPGLFGAAAALSTAHRDDEGYRTMDMAQYNRFYGQAWGRDLAGADRMTDRFREYNLGEIIRRASVADLRRTRYYLACGTQDTTYQQGTTALGAAFADRGVPAEVTLGQGGHSWSYWTAGAEPMFAFLGGQLG